MKLKKLLGVIFAFVFCACLSVSMGIIASADTAETSSDVVVPKTFLTVDYTNGTTTIEDTTVDYKGVGIHTNNQVVLLNTAEYDAPANGGWLTYKIEATEGGYISSLNVKMVGNRLGSFGMATGNSEHTVSFKPYISTSTSFGDPIEEIVLPVKEPCYNLDYDFTEAIGNVKSDVWYVKLWFGSTDAGYGFYFDWWQLGSIVFGGNETIHKEIISYTPCYNDVKAFYGNIARLDGGVQIKANAGLTIPMNANEIVFTAKHSIMPSSQQGGWLTYSFTKEVVASSGLIPNNGSGATSGAAGFYINVTCYSSDTAPNCIEIQLCTRSIVDGSSTRTQVSKFFVDNTVDSKVVYSIVKQTDATYTFVAADEATGKTLKTVTGIALDSSLFANEKGETYLSSAIYVPTGGTRPTVQIYSINAYTTPLTVKDVTVPADADVVDFYSCVNEIEGGIKYTADYAFNLPMNASNIVIDTKLNPNEGWQTYSFTSSPITTSSNIPKNGSTNATNGIYLNFDNVSSATTPDCVEIQVCSRKDGVRSEITKFYADYILDERIIISLVEDNGTYTLTLTNVTTGKVIRTVSGIAIDKTLFAGSENETYMSSAVYSSGVRPYGELYGVKTYFVDASSATVTVDDVAYTGSAIESPVTVTLNEKTLVEGTNYTVAYTNNTEIGTATATVTFTGIYSGVVTATFEILPIALNNENVTVTLSQTEYEFVEGEVFEPTVTVVYGEATLVEGTDYTVAYTNNTAVGTATATVTFTGIYSGSVEANYVINEKAPDTSSETSEEPSSSTETSDESTYTGSSCIATMGLGSILAFVALAGATVFFKKKEN